MRQIYSRYAGIGDALFVNTFAFQAGEETGKKITVATNYPELFLNNPHIRFFRGSQAQLGRYLRWSKRLGIRQPYVYMDYGNPEQEHIFDILQRKTGVLKKPIKPLIFLSENELRHEFFDHKNGTKIIGIQSCGVTGWTSNKNYFFDRYQKIVDTFPNAKFVQFGQTTDRLLIGAEDYRGKLTLREVFVALKQIDLFVGQVGFLMHAAAAVDCPSVIIYGGFEAPWQSGWEANTNIFSNIHCSPCWKEKCPYNHECMDMISAEMVMNEMEIKLNTILK